MQSLKILVSCVAKYCHLNLGKLVFDKKVNNKSLKVNLPLRKIFRGNLNAEISTNKIASFRSARKIFLKRKLTISKIPIQTREQSEENACSK